MPHAVPPYLDDDPPVPRPRPASLGRTAWVLLLVDGVLLGCGSLFWLGRGRFFDDAIYEKVGGASWPSLSAIAPSVERVASVAVRLVGVVGLCASILVIAVAMTSYRRGDRWAWYAMWALPLYCSLDTATLASYRALTPTAAAWNLALFTIALLALVAPYRRFFGARPSEPAAS